MPSVQEQTRPAFTDSPHCRGGQHCVTCRHRTEGRAWREQLRTAFSLPGDEADFECPHGKAWGFQPGVADTALAMERAAVCDKCPQNGGIRLRVNNFDVYRVRCRQCGCGGLSLLAGQCPAGKWADQKRARNLQDQPAVVQVPAPPPPAKPSGAAVTDIAVVGHPSRLGGADTELDHQIRVWQAMGVKVHLLPTGTLDQNLLDMKMQERGCQYHRVNDWPSLEGMHVISFCNGTFLQNLAAIRKHARTVSWVNCMTWNFPLEIEGHGKGLIDFHLYQTEHARDRVGAALQGRGVFRPILFTPYFHAEDFPFVESRPDDMWRFGRISRNDAQKWHPRQWWVYETMVAPAVKDGLALGFDAGVQAKVGPPPAYVRALPAGAVPQREFYQRTEAIIQMAETYENLPRVGFEAMSSGTLLVVDKRGGWNTEVIHGVTGWLCADEREFVYYASRAAYEKGERERMRRAARLRLEEHWGMKAAMESWGKVFDQWRALR